ncbi:MAG: pyruvate kinase, partial [bacterium]|nr:pyruvate kinase [bacterium]
MQRVKIVATLGPASDSAEVIRQLMTAGMDVVRLNFSHGEHELHRRVYETVREEARKL